MKEAKKRYGCSQAEMASGYQKLSGDKQHWEGPEIEDEKLFEPEPSKGFLTRNNYWERM